MTGKNMDGWSTIATRIDTKERLFKMKTLKAPGKLENYDDVIRRGMDMPPVEETEDGS